MLALLSYGEVLIDFLPLNTQPISYAPLAGGAPANVAVAYSKLGGDSYFAGGLSSDHFGQVLLNELQSNGVNTSNSAIIDNTNTAIVLVNLDSDGERSFNFYRNNTADTLYNQSHIASIDWSNIGIFHLCSNTMTTDDMHKSTMLTLSNAKENNVLVSFDVNLRHQLWPDLSLLPKRIEAGIKYSDIVKMSRDEALYLAKQNNLELDEYLQVILSFDVKVIVITDGAEAVQVLTQNFTTTVAVPNITAVDTTGAGDSFIAGFLFYLAEHLKQGESIIQAIADKSYIINAIHFASKCGAYTCQTKGAFAAMPLFEQL